MQITREKAFTPVLIKVESKEELAKLYGLSRHNGITGALELGDFFYKIRNVVTSEESELSDKWYDNLFEKFGVGK